MNAWVYIERYTWVYMYTGGKHGYVCIHIHVYVYLYTLCIHIYPCIHGYMCIHAHVNRGVHGCACIQEVYMGMYVYI